MTELAGKRVFLWAGNHHRSANCSTELFRAAAILTRHGCQVTAVFSLSGQEELLSGLAPDVILALPCCGFLEPLLLLSEHREQPDQLPPMILMVASADVPSYLDAMRQGAFDCLVLPVDETELIRVVNEAVESRELQPAVA